MLKPILSSVLVATSLVSASALATPITITALDFPANPPPDDLLYETSALGFRVAANCHLHIDLEPYTFDSDNSGCNIDNEFGFYNKSFIGPAQYQVSQLTPNPTPVIYLDRNGDTFDFLSFTYLYLPGGGYLNLSSSNGDSYSIPGGIGGPQDVGFALNWTDVTWILLEGFRGGGAPHGRGVSSMTFAVPEPSTVMLVLSALLTLSFGSMRRRAWSRAAGSTFKDAAAWR